ncbi:MAG: low molecular weight protein arginine phosphatase [Ardenticatenaceae bacterium]|nr:low molecular weight protein arginine phosphatase [Ardenticatenaceae bacterium]MCB9446340.1 low molecular weight protein arginine phosphatase [Ardenticatenaceae bacterium]
MAHILIVCTANICRSPVAEALLQDRLNQRELSQWTVSSAGTWAHWLRSASQFSIDVAQRMGLDISSHQSRMIDAALLEQADLVLCMEAGHVEAIQVEFPAYADKVYLLSEMVGEKYSVHDPYGESLTRYQQMASELSMLIDNGLERIIELAKGNANGR